MKKVLKQMKVVLIKDVPNLGQTGETKDVKPGYARNFLIAQKYAVLPNDPQARQIANQKIEKATEIKGQQKELENKVQDLKSQKIEFKVKVNKKGQPFRAIRSEQIARELQISKASVKITPIKTLGTHQVTIHSGDIEDKITVVVTPEK